MSGGSAAVAAGAVLLEARPFRPFKSSEEYLYAMKEDLAEWLNVLYPELRVTADNLLDRLDSGRALCRHANAVRESGRQLLERAESAESEDALALARALCARPAVSFLPAARPGTFFARDNLSNFIDWCRRALGVLECLLFETDDLCMRKNEKHVVLCLLEVARRGAQLGMPAPLLVLMERQIERELAGEECTALHSLGLGPGAGSAAAVTDGAPQPQVVTNDLRSLDERVRDLLARCSCPTQFPMMRVSEGKYRIGDTKLLIFVRILRSHVMVRVGGGWDTLEHYLDKHDPCRCRAQHRAALSARLRPARAHTPYAELAGATVTYEREQPASLPCLPSVAASPDRKPPASLRLSSPARASSRTRSGSPGCGSVSPERRIGGGGARPPLVSSPHLVPSPHAPRRRSPRPASPAALVVAAAGSESASDNGSEVSDEGYRSLGIVTSSQPSPSVHPQHGSLPLTANNNTAVTAAADDAEQNERRSLPAVGASVALSVDAAEPKVSESTGLRRTGYSHSLYGGPPPPAALPRRAAPASTTPPASRIPATAATAARNNPASTWSGRAGSRSRLKMTAETFRSPPRVRLSPHSSPGSESAFQRSSPLRASCTALRSSPAAAGGAANSAGNKTLSPLLEQILRSAENAKDDAAVLEKVKRIIRQYSAGAGGGAESPGSRASSRDSDYADFTSAWVMSDGRLQRSASSRQLAAPRRARAAPAAPACRIPAPLRAPL